MVLGTSLISVSPKCAIGISFSLTKGNLQIKHRQFGSRNEIFRRGHLQKTLKQLANRSFGGCGKAGPCQAQAPVSRIPPGNRLLQRGTVVGTEGSAGRSTEPGGAAWEEAQHPRADPTKCDALGSNTWLASEGRIFPARIQQSLMTSHHPLSAEIQTEFS